MFQETPLHPIKDRRNPDQGGVPDQRSGKWPGNFSLFRIFDKRRTPKERLRERGHNTFTWERRELPGAGAGQYAFETYGLPLTAMFGFGNINVTNPLRETSPNSYQFQSVPHVGIPPQGILQGQFVTQPLMDPNAAVGYGVVAPGAVPNGPNAIVNGAPVLGP